MNKLIHCLFVLLLNFEIMAQAAPSGSASISELSEFALGIERTLYFDTYFFTGYSTLDHSSLVDPAQGATNGLGFSIGSNIGSLFILGLATDYRWLSQSSEVDDSHPNFTGKRFVPVAPFLGLKLHDYIFKLDYQNMGNLEVSKSLPTGGTLKLTNPIGFRFTALFDKLFDQYPWGIYYESTEYRKKVLSDVGEVSLNSKFNTWQIGAMIAVIF